MSFVKGTRGEMWRWALRTYRRYGIFATFVKLFKRLELETAHLLLGKIYKMNVNKKEDFTPDLNSGPHILNIVQRYHPSIGGAEIYMKEISERLYRDGYRVTVYTTDAWDLEHFWKHGKRRVDSGKEVVNGVEIERYSVFRFPFHHIIMRLLYNLPFLFFKNMFSLPSPIVPGMWAKLLFKDHSRFDVVHVSAFPYNSLVYTAILYAKRNRLPLIITPFLHLGEYKNDKVNRYYTRHFQLKMLGECDRIVVQTSIERNFLIQEGIDAGKIHLVGQGVNLHEIQGGDKKRFRRKFNVNEEKIVFHVSTKTYDKGTMHLVEAMKKIWKTGGDIKLILAGPPMDDFNRYFSMQNSFVRNRCVVLDYIIGEDKRDLFAAGDVLVLPSRTDSFGAVFLEAWANKKPVIGARAGGVSEVIRHGEDGFLVRFGDIQALASYIKILLYDNEAAGKMGETGYSKVMGGMTWDEKYKILRGIFTDLN